MMMSHEDSPWLGRHATVPYVPILATDTPAPGILVRSDSIPRIPSPRPEKAARSFAFVPSCDRLHIGQFFTARIFGNLVACIDRSRAIGIGSTAHQTAGGAVIPAATDGFTHRPRPIARLGGKPALQSARTNPVWASRSPKSRERIHGAFKSNPGIARTNPRAFKSNPGIARTNPRAFKTKPG